MCGRSSLEDRVTIFEDTLGEFIEGFSENRIASAFCSEADIRMHLTYKLLSKLPLTDVHAELPIPLDVKQFVPELWVKGRVSSRSCVKADIAIIDYENFCPQIITELKFTPLYWGFSALLTVPRSKDEDNKSELRKALLRDLDFLQRRRSEKPSQKDVENIYFGFHRNGPTTVEKMIQIVNKFRIEEQKDVRAYLVVFDEFYPNIEEILNEAIDHLNPPDTFKIIATYWNISEVLQDTLKELTAPADE